LTTAPTVVLLRPPDDAPRDFYSVQEALGPAYVASFLRSQGVHVGIVDSIVRGWDVSETSDYLLSQHLDILGISLFSIATRQTREILVSLQAAKPHVHVTVGGQFPTFAWRDLLTWAPEIDSVVRFEGEEAFAALVDSIRAGRPLAEIPGLALRGTDGEPFLTPVPRRITELDSLPYPARDVYEELGDSRKAISICSSRGCWARCKYCTISAFYRATGSPGWVARAPTAVVDEIQSLGERYGCGAFAFVDADFVGPGAGGRQRARHIGEEILRRRLDIQYSFDCRPEVVDEALFSLLKDSGLSVVYMGIESGVQSQLDRWGRASRPEVVLRAIDTLRKLGIEIQAGYMLYDPWTTMEELVGSLEFVREIDCVSLPLFVRMLEIRPGMELEERIRREATTTKNGLFDYSYDFKDPRVEAFRNTLADSLGRVLTLYKHLVDVRQKSSGQRELFSAIERKMTRRVTETALELARGLRESGERCWQDAGTSQWARRCFSQIAEQATQELAAVVALHGDNGALDPSVGEDMLIKSAESTACASVRRS
jgi:anaerobic magnesium-protoporphyrin IX monomethyl ester cyclase